MRSSGELGEHKGKAKKRNTEELANKVYLTSFEQSPVKKFPQEASIRIYLADGSGEGGILS